MDGIHFKVIKKLDSGQSTVEYMLLIIVVVSFFYIIINSEAFQRYFGEESQLFALLREKVSFQYLHALDGNRNQFSGQYNQANHQSYVQEGIQSTRFFIPLSAYEN